MAFVLLITGLLFAWGAGDYGMAQPAGREKPILFLGNDSLPPMNFTKNGAPAGVTVDLLRALGKHMRRPVEIRLMDWAEAQRLVLDGRADALLQINPSPERMKLYDFSDPLLTSEFTIFTSIARPGITSMADLRGLKVAAENQGLPVSLLRREPEIDAKIVQDFVQGFRMLTEGGVDAVVADRWVGSYVIAENKIRGVKLIEEPVSVSQSAIAVKKGNPELLKEINQALAAIRQDGTYDRIVKSWRSKEVVFETREQLRLRIAVIVAISAALILALIGVIVLVREVGKRKRVEATLRESENRFRLALRNAPVSVAAQNRDLRYIWAYNQKTARPEEIIGRLDSDIFTPDEAAHVTAIKRRVLDEDIEIREQMWFDRPGGRIFLDICWEPVHDESGRVAGVASATIDLTPMKIAEEVLEQSRERFRLLAEATFEGIALTEKGRFLEVNDQFADMLCYRKEELIGTDVESLVLPGDRLRVMKNILDGHDSFIEHRSVRKDGSVITVEARGKPFIYDGRPVRMTAVRDVTERRLAEKAMRETEELLSIATAAAELGIHDYDVLSGAIRWDRRTREIWGVDSDEPINYATFTAGLHPEDLAATQAAVEKALDPAGDGRYYAEYRVISRRDGVMRWIAATGQVFFENGRAERLAGTVQDITERKHFEDALESARDALELRVQERTSELRKSEEVAKEQKREIEAYYQAAPIGLCVLDTDLRYLRINERLAEINGVPARDHIGRTVHEIVPWLGDEAERICRRILETGEPVTNMELTGTTRAEPGAQRIWVAGWYPLKDPGGKVAAISVVVEEVTRQRKLEEQLRQSQKMEAIGTLAGGIAHDFNNILAAILGFTEMAIDDVPDRPLVTRNLQNVLKSAMRARELVKQILAFSRKTGVERSPLSVTPVVKETVQFLRASIPATIEIKVSARAASDTVLASPVEIQQVLMNLATNASYAMQETGGTMEVSLTDIDFEPDSPVIGEGVVPGEYLRLMVRDTGTGMTPEVMKRVFEPFFTTREVGKGTGMGLAVVYGIVKDLQGTVAVESEPGTGSIFRVFLPKVKTGPGVETGKADRITGGDEKILFVDDEEMLVEWGRSTLERLGYRVTAVMDSIEALDLFSADPSFFDLVITDQAMSKMDGSQLARELLRIRSDIPIILCTGHSETTTAEKAEEIGIREFLLKPLTRQELADAVRRLLDAGAGCDPII